MVLFYFFIIHILATVESLALWLLRDVVDLDITFCPPVAILTLLLLRLVLLLMHVGVEKSPVAHFFPDKHPQQPPEQGRCYQADEENNG